VISFIFQPLCRRCTRGGGASFSRLKWPMREADHSLPSSAEVKNAWSYTSATAVVQLRTGTTLHFTFTDAQRTY
jgi:hypothetical protein